MNTELLSSIQNTREEGIYIIQPEGVVNYGRRWSGYGYMVPQRLLELTDLVVGVIFALDISPFDREQVFTLVKHIDTIQDARKMANDLGVPYVYDLREKLWITP